MDTAVVIVTGSSVVDSMIFLLFLSRGSLLLFFFLELVEALLSHIVILPTVNA